jgi:hypothetical protein
VNNSNSSWLHAPAASHRQIYNLTLIDDHYADRTRLVVNEEAMMDYETTCDASKFLSDDADIPQIYIYDNGIRYAIDERPMGEGIFHIGMRLGKTGEYTLRLQASQNADGNAVLTDNITGETIALSDGDYTFTAEAGFCDGRFTLTFGDLTAISSVPVDTTGKRDIYTLDGKRTLGKTLPAGIYVVKQNGHTHKMVVR